MKCPVPSFPRPVAKAIVRRINSLVDFRIKKSKLDVCNCEGGNTSFQVFKKSDLQLGKIIGSGRFSNVYEIQGFNTTCKRYKQNSLHQNNKKSSFVVKTLKLKKKKDPKKFCTAAADLVMEAHYLSNLNHKNILSIRGWAATGVEAYLDGEHDSFFLILDRLEDTLDKRLKRWSEIQIRKPASYTKQVETWQTRRQIKMNDSSSNLISRIKVAHQISSAVQYLHSKNIIFRDLKPNNVGFDEFGTVKIFDFGLCREMPEELENVNDVYHMSGKVGTLRYMAPEVALSKRYNQKVDTYSWALLFWYCLSLSKPYPNTTRSQYLEEVCQNGVRPALNHEWSDSIQYLLEKSWAHDPYNRLTMLEVCAFLERIEKELESSERSLKFRKLQKPCKVSSSMVPLPTIFIEEASSPVVPVAA